MNRCWLAAALALTVAAALADSARAERVPTMRTEGMRNPGVRGDLTVPYLTTGYSTFMTGAVAPRIYSSPIVNDPVNPQARPVYNLIFYGGRQAFGDRSNGAVPRMRMLPIIP
jgi:hypothetical protein